jgi:hypothetical protein
VTAASTQRGAASARPETAPITTPEAPRRPVCPVAAGRGPASPDADRHP